VHFLSGSITFDAAVTKVNEATASLIVWLDAFLTNVDRTVRNTNMLSWHKELWLIDFGAALYFHHSWDNWQEQSVKPFVQIKDHVLLPQATELDKVDVAMQQLLTPQKLKAIVDLIPDTWLVSNDNSETPESKRAVYYNFLISRLNASAIFVNEAKHARESLI
jgi:hypothetical protein